MSLVTAHSRRRKKLKGGKITGDLIRPPTSRVKREAKTRDITSLESQNCWSHHGNVSLEDLLDELVLGRVDELDDVGVEAVSVFLQEAWKKDEEKHQRLDQRQGEAGGARLDPGPRLWDTLAGTDQAGCFISIFK